MKKILSLIILSQVIFLSYAEKKISKIVENNLTIKELFNDSTTVFDGQFFFKEERSLATQQNTPEVLSASGAFVNTQNFNLYDPGVTLKLNGYEVGKHGNEYNGEFAESISNQIVGHVVTITSQTATNNNTNLDFNTQLYFPKAIHINMSSYKPMGFEQSGNMLTGTDISEGNNIQWNADLANNLGVFLSLDYNPNQIGNTALKNAGYNKPISNFKEHTDDGADVFDNELFKNIPKGAIVTFRISRGNTLSYKLPKNTNKKVQFVFTTSETAKFRVSKNN